MLADGYGNQLILQGNSDEKTSFVVVNTVKKILPCVSKIVAFIVKNIDTINFFMFNWLAKSWLDPSHALKIKART